MKEEGTQGTKKEGRQEGGRKEGSELCPRTGQSCACEMLNSLQSTLLFLYTRDIKYWLLKKTNHCFIANQILFRGISKGFSKELVYPKSGLEISGCN